MKSSEDTDGHEVNEKFEAVLSEYGDSRKALESGFLRKVKTKTATLTTVDKDKLDKFFADN